MHTFSLHTSNDEHIGFLVMLPDEDGANSGLFAVKLQSEFPPQNPQILNDLRELSQREDDLLWQVRGDKVDLFDSENNPIGTIRQQMLRVGGNDFILNDLTGMI